MKQSDDSLPQARILIVEDERGIRRPLSRTLTRQGHHVTEAESGTAALELLAQQEFDLALIDLKLGDINGLEVLAAIREDSPDMVVIILTGHGSLESSVQALRQGAHDYLLKPCKTVELNESVRRGLIERQQKIKQRELLGRLKELLDVMDDKEILGDSSPETDGPPPGSQQRILQRGNLIVDFLRQVILLDEQLLELSPTEFSLLAYLISEAPRVVSPQELVLEVQNYETEKWEASYLIRQHIYNIRNKIKKVGSQADIIRTVRGRGYMID